MTGRQDDLPFLHEGVTLGRSWIHTDGTWKFGFVPHSWPESPQRVYDRHHTRSLAQPGNGGQRFYVLIATST